MTNHLGWEMVWKDPKTKYGRTIPDRIECRKRFSKGSDQADILIVVYFSDSTVSMNGTAHLTAFDLHEMASVMSRAKHFIQTGFRP